MLYTINCCYYEWYVLVKALLYPINCCHYFFFSNQNIAVTWNLLPFVLPLILKALMLHLFCCQIWFNSLQLTYILQWLTKKTTKKQHGNRLLQGLNYVAVDSKPFPYDTFCNYFSRCYMLLYLLQYRPIVTGAKLTVIFY